MKIIYVSDLHGDRFRYERLYRAAKNFNANVVINGGDMLPENELFKQGEFITDYLVNHFMLFESAKIFYLSFLGNDDLKMFDKIFEESCLKFSFVKNLSQSKVKISDFEFIGFNLVVNYPFRLKDRCRRDVDNCVFVRQYGKALLSNFDGLKEIDDWFSYINKLPTIENELNKLVRPDNMSNCIYIIHMPPCKLGLDVCYDGSTVGSKAVYNFLSKNQPKLSLHGHIHESPEVSGRWFGKIGNTICIQPGQTGRFTYVAIDLSTMEFERIKE